MVVLPTARVAWVQILATLGVWTSGARADDNDGDDVPTPTTAPVFLPEWNQQSWSLVRGSVISTNPTASETTYTIFCPEQTPPACGLSLEFPFELVEGPDTIQFHGTYTSTFIVDLGCELNSTTAAKCSGYSSYKSGYSNGWVTGPTEISWTSTFTGSDVEYGVLTMADKPKHTHEALDIEATAPQPTSTYTDDGALPAETGDAGEAISRGVMGKAIACALISASLLAHVL